MIYPDAFNADLLSKIPLTAKEVLDVGSGSGALAMEYRLRNPSAVWYAIEENPQMAKLAASRVNFLAQTDLDEIPLPFGEQRFDCIIYGDILEHLKDPWGLLAKHAAVLNVNGLILICMPNLEHWSFTANLLKGGWQYSRCGLFDKTHLRWFTYQTTYQAIIDAGLQAIDVSPRIFDADACSAFIEDIKPAISSLDIDVSDYFRRASPLQHVWRTVRQRGERINVVSTMLAPVGGVSDVRVIEPMNALATLPDVFSLVVRSQELPRFEPHSPKIFIFHRPLLAGEEGLKPLLQLISLGYLIVCEFDDHPDYIPVLQRPDVQNFRAVHAIQTSTVPLAEVLARENGEIGVFPNSISHLEKPRNFINPDQMTLFFGGINRENDWQDLMPAINNVAKIVGTRLRFEVINDLAFFDALETPNKNFTPLCDYSTYLEILGRCEFSLMPLHDTPFNRCKSDLKFIEAAAQRVTSLASPIVYEGVIEDCVTGVVFRDPTSLRDRLLSLISTPYAAITLAEAAREYVKNERMLAYQIGARRDWYWSLWNDRKRLHVELLTRVPELGRMLSSIGGTLPAEFGNIIDLKSGCS